METQKTKAELQNERNARELHTRLVREMRVYLKEHAPMGQALAVTTFAGAKRITEERAQSIYADAVGYAS